MGDFRNTEDLRIFGGCGCGCGPGTLYGIFIIVAFLLAGQLLLTTVKEVSPNKGLLENNVTHLSINTDQDEDLPPKEDEVGELHASGEKLVDLRPPEGTQWKCPTVDPSKTRIILLVVGSVRSFIYPTMHEYYYRNQVKILESYSNAQVHQIW